MRPSRGLNWSEDEIAFLVANAEILPIEKIARKMNRSRPAIERKAYYLGVSLKPTLDHWSGEELAKLLGINGTTVSYWIANGQLKTTRTGKGRTAKHRISRKKFAIFYKEYKDKKTLLKRIDPSVLAWILE